MKKILELTDELAEKIGLTCIAEANENDWLVSVAVCDSGGHLLWMKRSHNVPPVSSYIAINKAKTAAMGRRPSKVYEDQINNGRYAFLSAPEIQGLMEGGLPIFYENSCIGAIGVSNLKPSQDTQVAQAGIDFFNSF